MNDNVAIWAKTIILVSALLVPLACIKNHRQAPQCVFVPPEIQSQFANRKPNKSIPSELTSVNLAIHQKHEFVGDFNIPEQSGTLSSKLYNWHIKVKSWPWLKYETEHLALLEFTKGKGVMLSFSNIYSQPTYLKVLCKKTGTFVSTVKLNKYPVAQTILDDIYYYQTEAGIIGCISLQADHSASCK